MYSPHPSDTRSEGNPTAFIMPIDPNDPRLQRVGYAKLVGQDLDLELFIRKLEIVLGRTSKSQSADVQLGDNMNISRQVRC